MEKTARKTQLTSVFIALLSVILVLFLGVTDYLTGEELSFSIFYLIPILFITWKVGRTAGILISVASAITWYISDISTSHYSHFLIPFWNSFVRLSFFLIASYLLSWIRIELNKEQEISRTDPITQVRNSRAFFELADLEIERSRRHRHPFCLAYIDLDNFKEFNDSRGHNAGDRLLRFVADIMKDGLRKVDIIARLGGDEFALLLPETDAKTGAAAIERLRDNLLESTKVNNWPVTFSIGVTTFIIPPASVDDMIKEADSLMYEAKSKGKDTIVHKTT